MLGMKYTQVSLNDTESMVAFHRKGGVNLKKYPAITILDKHRAYLHGGHLGLDKMF